MNTINFFFGGSVVVQYDKDGKVILPSELVVLSLLDDLLKNKIINVATYNKAVKEVKSNGNSKK